FGQPEIDREKKNKELKSLEQRIQALQAGLDGLAKQKHALISELKDNEQAYGKLSRELKELNDELTEQEKRLVTVRKISDLNRNKILGFKETLVRQLRAAYAMGRQERLQLLLNQKDPLRLGRMLIYYDYLNKQRVTEAKALHAALEALRISERELLTANERLIGLRKDREAELQSLAESRSARRVLLAKLERDYRGRRAKLEQIEQNERELQNLIDSLEKVVDEVPFEPEPTKSISSVQRRFSWPVDGNLLQSYGSKTASGHSNGVMISAREGDPVRAVADGRVVYADWLVHYGLLIIVDHGIGYMSLYAFNQSLYKAVGDRVSSGETIASVGRSGGRSVPALYFEVRKNGKPVNPKDWWNRVHTGTVD
ncbi:MAG: murein hydrolase activator EnvC family protein, partial [Methylococcales bacterium]